MRQIMHYDREFRREEATSQSALTRSTDGARVNSTPPPAWTMGGGLGGAKDRSFCYGAQIFGALRFS
jgi:hypothetical protein